MTKKDKKKYLFRATKEDDSAIRKALTMLFWHKRGVPDYYDFDIWYIMQYGKVKFLYYKAKAKISRHDFEHLTGKLDEYYRWLG